MAWFRKELQSAASVLFRGNLLPRAEEFASLSRRGIEIQYGPAPKNGTWSLNLSHPKWGEANVLAIRDLPTPPEELLAITAGLSDGDRAEIGSAGMALAITSKGRRGDVPADRKGMLFFARAVMGNEGVGVMDHNSLLAWTREALDCELDHDAPLDINQMYTIHAVYEGRAEEYREAAARTTWVHTHGLAELGGWDFDVMNPSGACVESSLDELCRALAFRSAEGAVKPGATIDLAYHGAVSFVDAGEFQRAGPREDAEHREHDEAHSKQRVVVCEPRKRGYMGFGGKRIRGASLFRKDDYDGLMINFGDEASELMSRRARETIGTLASLIDEFSDIGLPALVKLGLDTASGGREHPWFTIERIEGGMIHGVCENEPFDIPGLQAGDRGSWPAERASDWLIMTPAGQISPRTLRLAGVIRANRDEIKKFVEEHRFGDD